MTKHIPPAGQSLIGIHTYNADCECSPTRIVKRIARSSGRGGRHQGYRMEETFQHNVLELA